MPRARWRRRNSCASCGERACSSDGGVQRSDGSNGQHDHLDAAALRRLRWRAAGPRTARRCRPRPEAPSVCCCQRSGFGAGGALTVALPNCELFTVLNTAQLQQALQAVKTRALAAGEPLLLPHTTQRLALLAVLAAASVTVLGPAAARGLRRRRQSLRPGMALGAAQLPGAEAHANVSSQPHQPDTEALAALRRDKAAPLTQPVQPSGAASVH